MDDSLRDAQRRVADFTARHDVDAAPEYRLLDLASEVGELAKDALESTDYGAVGPVELSDDEVGDVLFALLALADSCDVDVADALETALAKYEDRLAADGRASSGSHDDEGDHGDGS